MRQGYTYLVMKIIEIIEQELQKTPSFLLKRRYILRSVSDSFNKTDNSPIFSLRDNKWRTGCGCWV